MTKEELEKEAKKYADGIYHYKINVSDYGEEGKINYRYSDVKEAYLASAEPREKQIAELTEQNTSLLTSVENLNKSVQELEKENAELKEKYVKNITDCDICDTYCNSQLTKAKELLKQLVDIEYAINIPKEKIISLRVKAEQFLSEVEK